MASPVATDQPEKALQYNHYMRSAAWRKSPARLREFAAADFKCRLCAAGPTEGAGLEAHHRSYIRFGHEIDGDLTALCRPCHNEVTSFLRRRRYASTVPFRSDTRRMTVVVPLFDPTREELFV
jgi:hypothetical protein